MQWTTALLFAALVSARPAAAQDAAPPVRDGGPKVGDMAPDFSLPGSTKDGKLNAPVRLSNLKGQVVVVTFFPKARTSG